MISFLKGGLCVKQSKTFSSTGPTALLTLLMMTAEPKVYVVEASSYMNFLSFILPPKIEVQRKTLYLNFHAINHVGRPFSETNHLYCIVHLHSFHILKGNYRPTVLLKIANKFLPLLRSRSARLYCKFRSRNIW